MGLSLDVAIPEEEEVAISLLGESFPPAHAFEALLLSLSLHPQRLMSQQHVDDLFQRATELLSPQPVEWNQMTQVTFHGWSRLVCKGMEFHEGCNLAGAVQMLWKVEHRYGLYFHGPPPVTLCQPPASEGSYFDYDEHDESCQVRICRPGWPSRWVPLPQGSQTELEECIHFLSGLWNTDEAVTTAVWASDAMHRGVALLDEVTCETVPMRLILSDNGDLKAKWAKAVTSVDEVQALSGIQPCQAFTINGGEVIFDRAKLHDGDVIRVVPLHICGLRHKRTCEVAQLLPCPVREHDPVSEPLPKAPKCDVRESCNQPVGSLPDCMDMSGWREDEALPSALPESSMSEPACLHAGSGLFKDDTKRSFSGHLRAGLAGSSMSDDRGFASKGCPETGCLGFGLSLQPCEVLRDSGFGSGTCPQLGSPDFMLRSLPCIAPRGVTCLGTLRTTSAPSACLGFGHLGATFSVACNRPLPCAAPENESSARTLSTSSTQSVPSALRDQANGKVRQGPFTKVAAENATRTACQETAQPDSCLMHDEVGHFETLSTTRTPSLCLGLGPSKKDQWSKPCALGSGDTASIATCNRHPSRSAPEEDGSVSTLSTTSTWPCLGLGQLGRDLLTNGPVPDPTAENATRIACQETAQPDSCLMHDEVGLVETLSTTSTPSLCLGLGSSKKDQWPTPCALGSGDAVSIATCNRHPSRSAPEEDGSVSTLSTTSTLPCLGFGQLGRDLSTNGLVPDPTDIALLTTCNQAEMVDKQRCSTAKLAATISSADRMSCPDVPRPALTFAPVDPGLGLSCQVANFHDPPASNPKTKQQHSLFSLSLSLDANLSFRHTMSRASTTPPCTAESDDCQGESADPCEQLQSALSVDLGFGSQHSRTQATASVDLGFGSKCGISGGFPQGHDQDVPSHLSVMVDYGHDGNSHGAQANLAHVAGGTSSCSITTTGANMAENQDAGTRDALQSTGSSCGIAEARCVSAVLVPASTQVDPHGTSDAQSPAGMVEYPMSRTPHAASEPHPSNNSLRSDCFLSDQVHTEQRNSSEGPLNPMLPWPRFEPQSMRLDNASELFSGHSIPPTQKFQVLLTHGTDQGSCSFPCHANLADGNAGGEPQQSNRSSVREWQKGGLKGGAVVMQGDECIAFEGLNGWWLSVEGKTMRGVPLDKVGGRTVRQERETLQLQDIDLVKCEIFVVASCGVIRARWDYKFPYAANDGVVLFVMTRGSEARDAIRLAARAMKGRLSGACLKSEQDLDMHGPWHEAVSSQAGDCEQLALSSSDRFSSSSISLLRATASHSQSSALGSQDVVRGDDDGTLRSHGRSDGSGSIKRQKTLSAKVPASSRPDEQCGPKSCVVFFAFLQGWRCIRCHESQTIAQIMEDEWGVSHADCIMSVNGRRVSAQMKAASVPHEVPVRITSRLKGGGQAQIKKLKELLIAKGVAAEDVQSRVAEITAAIGEGSLAEVFNCFDSWQALKAKCQGKLRIIKQSEMRQSKPKKLDEDEQDPLQDKDPWAEALQCRQIKPEPSFFATSTGAPPAFLSSVTHGCSGLALVEVKEAQVLAKAVADLSPDELSVLVLGEPSLPDAKRPHRQIEFPCHDHKGCRMLVKGVLIDLGATPMQVAGEHSKYSMKVINSSCVACEVHRQEYEEWDDFIGSSIRHLKRTLALSSEDLLHTWGKKAYRQGKQVSPSDSAESVFVMLRIKAACLEQVLKVALPGLYLSPRLESGEPGCGVRVRCQEYSVVRKRLYPDWIPQENTPYNTSLPQRFELHHVHPGASKGDLQDLLNAVAWKALVIKQIRPRQWLVAAEASPAKDTILTEHGCILVLRSQTQGHAGLPKGKGKGKKGKSPEWLLGSHPTPFFPDKASDSGAPVSAQVPRSGEVHGPVKQAVLEVEQKMEQRFAAMREEASVTHELLKQDIHNIRSDFKEHVAQQKQENAALAERVTSVETSLVGQLSGFMSTLNATLAQQSQDLSGKILEGQQSLRAELTQEFRQQFGNVRKRTPPPAGGSENEDKRMRDGE